MKVAVVAAWFAFACLIAAPSPAQAQTYPAKPVRIVVPFAPGGALDVLARTLGAKLTETMGQPVIVDNRPGAGGNLGTDAVAKAAPDGHMILLTTSGLAIAPSLYRSLPFDPHKDFAPVTQLVAGTLVLIASPQLQASSVKQLLDLQKARPKGLNFGHTGIANPLYLTLEMLRLAGRFELTAVSYRSDALLNTAVQTGEVDAAVAPLGTALPQIEDKRVRALAVTSAQRSEMLADVPTFREAGFPAVEHATWQGLFVPAATPREIVATIQRECARALQQPDMRERIRTLASEPVGNSSEEFAARYHADLAKYAALVKAAGIPYQD